MACLRDDRPDLRWPGCWDLPGGGREEGESAEGCLLRELDEEFGLQLSPARLLYRYDGASMVVAGQRSVFFGGLLGADDVEAVRFGPEGQRWEMMAVEAFLAHPLGIPELQRRCALAWAVLQGQA